MRHLLTWNHQSLHHLFMAFRIWLSLLIKSCSNSEQKTCKAHVSGKEKVEVEVGYDTYHKNEEAGPRNSPKAAGSPPFKQNQSQCNTCPCQKKETMCCISSCVCLAKKNIPWVWATMAQDQGRPIHHVKF